MSAPKPPQPPAGSDPSMEDILSSIRRILTEDEATPSPPPAAEGGPGEDVLMLDAAMMVPEPRPTPTAMPAPAPQPDPAGDTARVTPPTPTVAAAALREVVRSLAANPAMPVRQGGPSIEDLVREELRPLLKAWLDRHLEPLLERLVKAEIERVVGRAQR